MSTTYQGNIPCPKCGGSLRESFDFGIFCALCGRLVFFRGFTEADESFLHSANIVTGAKAAE